MKLSIPNDERNTPCNETRDDGDQAFDGIPRYGEVFDLSSTTNDCCSI